MDNFRLGMIMERPFKYFPVVITRYQTNYWCFAALPHERAWWLRGLPAVLKELRGQGPRCRQLAAWRG